MALHTWWLYVITVFFVSGSPGPNMLHVMARSVSHGLSAATVAMVGCFLGVVTLLTLSAAGLTAVLLAIPGAFLALRLAGAAYLIWLGIRSWTAKEAPINLDDDSGEPAISGWALFRSAYAISISNPKALLFAAAFLPQFIDSSRAEWPQFTIMVLTFGAIEISWYFVYALGGRSLAGWLERPSPRKLFNRVTGGVFVAFGLAMAGTRA